MSIKGSVLIVNSATGAIFKGIEMFVGRQMLR